MNMNIHDAGVPSGRKAEYGRFFHTNRQQNTSNTGSESVPIKDSVSISSTSVLSAVEKAVFESALAEIGLSTDMLTPGRMLRALTLFSNNIPLDAALINGESSDTSSIPAQLTQILDSLYAFSQSENITAELRTFLSTITSSLETIMNAAGENVSTDALTANIEQALGQVLSLKSGMQFEWRLLAWYRSGEDHSSFRQLIHDDVKGLLFLLSNRLRQMQKQSALPKGMEKLAKDTDRLLGTISHRQLALVLDTASDRRVLPLYLPGENGAGQWQTFRLSDDPENSGSKRPGKTNGFSFSVTTSQLGEITVTFDLSGKLPGLQIRAEDEDTGDLINENISGLVASLRARGCDIVKAGVSRRKKHVENGITSNDGSSSSQVDYSG